MQAATKFEGLSFDGLPPCQNGLGLSEGDGFGRHVVRTLVGMLGVVVIDEAGPS